MRARPILPKALTFCLAIMSIAPGFLLIVAALSGNLLGLAYAGSALIILWGSHWVWRRRRRVGLALLSASALVAIAMYLPVTLWRYRFMSITGQMEGPDGYGSPMAFAINMVGEHLMLVPALGVLALCASMAVGDIRGPKDAQRIHPNP